MAKAAKPCIHHVPRYKCAGCTRRYNRAWMTKYRANPVKRRIPCPHGSKWRWSCDICRTESTVINIRNWQDRAALRAKGKPKFPFESFNPIMEMISE